MQPTIVLVHGAFAESSSWDDVVEPLVVDGFRVVVSNPTATVHAIFDAVELRVAV